MMNRKMNASYCLVLLLGLFTMTTGCMELPRSFHWKSEMDYERDRPRIETAPVRPPEPPSQPPIQPTSQPPGELGGSGCGCCCCSCRRATSSSGQSSNHATLELTDIDLGLALQDGVITDGLDSLDRIGFVATMPIMLTPSATAQLWQTYPGISDIQVEEGLQLPVLDESVFSVNYAAPAALETEQPPSEATQTLVTFDGSALDGLKLLTDLGFTEINVDPQAMPDSSLTTTGSVGQWVGQLLHFELQQVDNSASISINGIPATLLTQGTSISEVMASVSPLDVVNLLAP